MPDTAWKQTERRIAKRLGGRRTPLSGQGSGHGTSSDVLDVPEYVEIKRRKRSRLFNELAQRDGKAKRQHRRPAILCERTSTNPEDPPEVSYLALWLEDYLTHRDRFPHRAWLAETDAFHLAHFCSKAGPTHAKTLKRTMTNAASEDRNRSLVCIQVHHKNRILALAPLDRPVKPGVLA